MTKFKLIVLKNEKCSVYSAYGLVRILAANEIASQNKLGSYVYESQIRVRRK